MKQKVQNRLIMVAYLGVVLAYGVLFYVKYKSSKQS